MITVTFDTTHLARAFDQLKNRAVFATTRALNKAAVSQRTVLARSVSQDMKIRVGDANKQLSVRQATHGHQVATVSAGSRRLPLYAFGAKSTRRGVTANTGRGRQTYPGAFITQMRSGHLGVFARATRGKGSKRLPIVQKFGPSIAHVATKHAPAAAERGRSQLEKYLAHEIEFELGRMTP